MRAVLVLGGLLALGGCGGGGTTGTNYSDAPPVATIVATPSPQASETPAADPAPAVEAPVPALDAAEPANDVGEANAL